MLLGHTELNKSFASFIDWFKRHCPKYYTEEFFLELEEIVLHKYETIIANKGKDIYEIVNIGNLDCNYTDEYWDKYIECDFWDMQFWIDLFYL